MTTMEFTEGEKQAMKLLCEIGICMRIMFLTRHSVRIKCGSGCLCGIKEKDEST